MSQDACCAAVRRFLSERVGERLLIDARPDRNERNAPAVEEVWRSGAHGYVVEHTSIEAFEAQIQDDIAFQRLVAPLEQRFAGALPGRFAAGGTILAMTDVGSSTHVSAVFRIFCSSRPSSFTLMFDPVGWCLSGRPDRPKSRTPPSTM